MRSEKHLVRLPFAAVALSLWLAGCASSRAPTPPAPVPRPVAPASPAETDRAPREEVEPSPPSLLGAAEYDLPVEANTWVEEELEFLAGERQQTLLAWMQRGAFYEGFIKEVLRQEGVPADLYYLAMIESGFVPTARSHAGAVGMWQFMPATGRGLGLRIDPEVDERMDPVRATRAAARHLNWLYRSLGDWALAAAAYNAGRGRITRGLERFTVDNFWDLAVHGDLAKETRDYVPRLYAVTILGHDPERFGLSLAAAPEGGSSFAFDSVYVEYATPVAELARIGDLPVQSLQRLNPHLLRSTTPDGGYWVWVPQGVGAAVQRAWLASDFRKHKGYGIYVARPGDFLGRIAERAGMKMARVRELNPGIDFDNLQIGARVRLPFAIAQEMEARPPSPPADPVRVAAHTAQPEPVTPEEEVAPTDVVEVEHRVRDGETMWAIARQYALSVEALQEANGRGRGDAVIRPGDVLVIPVAGEIAERSSTQPAARHTVQSGDTLWSIARKHGASVDALRAANDLQDGVIVPGQTLVIPR